MAFENVYEGIAVVDLHFSSRFEASQAAGIPMLKYNVYKTADKETKELVQLHEDHAPMSVEKEPRQKERN